MENDYPEVQVVILATTPFNMSMAICHLPSPLVQKLHPCGDIAFQPYEPTFLTTHLMAVVQPSRYSVSITEILLFDSVFYSGVTPISVKTLKPQASSIVGTHI